MRKRYMPFLLSIAIIVLDQLSKALIVHFIPEGNVAYGLFGDFLWICHVRNDAVAFSLGAGFPLWVKYIFFIALPLLLMAVLSWCVVSPRFDKDTSALQRWCLAGIVGGGVGNLVDRCFRSLRVVDWISTYNGGLFGMERFPTYNIADASVVISVIILIISLFISERSKK